jgi:hypothetical protein
MKTIKSIFTILILSVAFTTISCDVEPIDPALSFTDDGGDADGDGGTSSGDYWPTAINNVWNMERDGLPLDPIKIIATGTFNGQTYYKFAPQSGTGTTASGTATTWLNKNGGNYKYKVDEFTFDAGGFSGTQSGFEYIVLKDNLDVGQTWSGTFTQTTTMTGIPSITMTTNYTGTILAKNVTEVVDVETYTNVIKVKLVQNASISGMPAATVETEAWYAKNVGPIKSVSTDSGIIYESILVDYTLF